ncbi:unnamed protein product [Spirodela intermedia]|uniref:Cobalamin-independent methionine synthase MetE N-terminal domain-containing protein n=1 Tax=Spirodela intermedia TaxID=51605 RepID=A0A7I8K861_SPIIN|nr:unnamed protein product [Spirodela intermedia]
MSDAGIKYIPSNTFSFYDQVLYTTAILGAAPDRYGYTGGEIGHDIYFSLGRGNANLPFSYGSHKAVSEYKKAKVLGVDTVPVLIGPVIYLLLSKPAKGVEKSFSPLSLLPNVLPVYKEAIADLKEAGTSWIQFDEPTLVLDLDAQKNKIKSEAFIQAYGELESFFSCLNVLIETYFADVPAAAYKTMTSLSGVSRFGFDLVRGTKTLDLIKRVVDRRNIWANDLAASLNKLVVSTSCSLLHTTVDLINESKLDDEIKSWLAFAAQKIVEVDGLAKALGGQKNENKNTQQSRRRRIKHHTIWCSHELVGRWDPTFGHGPQTLIRSTRISNMVIDHKLDLSLNVFLHMMIHTCPQLFLSHSSPLLMALLDCVCSPLVGNKGADVRMMSAPGERESGGNRVSPGDSYVSDYRRFN